MTTLTDIDPAQLATGLPDHVYNLVLLLQQAASDVVRYECFAADADHAGDAEVATWMRELAASDRDVVARARLLLAARLTTGATSSAARAGSDQTATSAPGAP